MKRDAASPDQQLVSVEPRRDAEGLLAGFDAICERLAPLSKRDRDAQLRALRHQGLSTEVLDEVASYFRLWGTGDDRWSLVGRNLGPFEFLDVLGAGGMGVVYLARHQLRQFQCAVKVSRESCLDDFLLSEAELLQSVHLAGVARVLEVGRLSVSPSLELLYVATEVVFGWPIDVYCRRHQLNVTERGQLLIKVIETVANLHEQHSLSHLDIKAANVLIESSTQTPKLIDFGIAYRRGITQRGPVALTPETASPEQHAPDVLGMPGHKSDVFSLGLLAKVVMEDGSHRLCPRLRRLLDSACANSLRERPNDARTFARELSRALDEQLSWDQRQRRTRNTVFSVTACCGFVVAALLCAPRIAERFNLEGRQLQNGQRPLMASRAFERATQLAPGDPTAHYNLATALEDIGDLERARVEYHEAQENGLGFLPALNNLARLTILDGQPEQAVPLLRRGLDVTQPRDSDSAYRLHKNLGWAYLELARIQPETTTAALALAREHLEQALNYNRTMKEEDVGRETYARHDAAGYCLLAKTLALGLTANPLPANEARLRWLWRTCRDTDAHGEPHHEGWKLEADTAMAAMDR